ncbi:MAG TPA: lantibiotic dehydratase [Blastocatellia bacterium]
MRGSGFPIDTLKRLTSPECANHSDRVIQAEDRLQQARDGALEALNTALHQMRQDNGWNITEARPFLNAITAVKKKKPVSGPIEDLQAAAALFAVDAASEEVNRAKAGFSVAFQSAVKAQTAALKEIAASRPFREAVIWQNRRVVHDALDPLLKTSPDSAGRGNKQRQCEELVAIYVQRYCAKNDSIGFFGPIGWASLDLGREFDCRPGDTLLSTRSVYFENWGIEKLALALCGGPAFLRWIKPRRNPMMEFSGSSAWHPTGRAIDVTPLQAAVLRLSDGDTTAEQIASKIIGSPTFDVTGERAVLRALEELASVGFVSWSMVIPLELHPEKTMAGFLESVDDDKLTIPAKRTLTKVEAAREKIAASAGDPERLDDAIRELETIFIGATGDAATRAPGRTYAARTLVYEDCRRNADVTVGAEVIEALAGPLSLVLTSARWLTWEVMRRYKPLLWSTYRRLADQRGASRVRAVDYLLKIQHLVYGDGKILVDEAIADFRDRWASILSVPDQERCVSYSSDQLKQAISERFDAPAAGWTGARYHSPDIMIAASGIDAIRRGDFQLVLGEIHIANNTLRGSNFVSQHPSPDSLYGAIEADFPDPQLVPVLPRNLPGLTNRTNPVLKPAKDFAIEMDQDVFEPVRSKALQIGTLIIEPLGDRLTIATRDGAMRFDVAETVGQTLARLVIDSFRVVAGNRHTPRINIDQLVVCRETWRVPVRELEFASDVNEESRFLATSRWRRELGLPQRVFVRLPVETKPFYVDFDSPIYGDLFTKGVRRSFDEGGVLVVSEMLPDCEQNWLQDAEGNAFTGELRIIVLDTAQCPYQ